MLDFPSLLSKGLRILMLQLSEVYCSTDYIELLDFSLLGSSKAMARSS